MNCLQIISQTLITGLCLIAFGVHAQTPVWTFAPLTETHFTVSYNENITVSYQITNQSKKNHTLTLKPIPGITQVTTSGSCSTSFTLSYQQSCVLNLIVNGKNLKENIQDGPVLCSDNNYNQCYQPSAVNSLHVIKKPVIVHTLSGTVTGLVGTVILLNNNLNPTSINANGSFAFSMPVAQGSSYNVTIANQPLYQSCSITNGTGIVGDTDVSNIAVTCSSSDTTISVDSTGTIPVNNGSKTITITNTGASIAYNVHAILPTSWVNVMQDASNCMQILPSGTCSIHFSSSTPYIAQGNIALVGDNITTSPTTALAFTMNGYLVWAISNSLAQVIPTADAIGSPVNWSTDFTTYIGVGQNTTSPCLGSTNGFCDTAQIVAHYATPYSTYAAGLCYQITSDNSGTVPIGTWYLPAICQMGGAGQEASCQPGLDNIDSNLVQLGFGSLLGDYWSSTEFSQVTISAWPETFAPNGGSNQGTNNFKLDNYKVRCARSIQF